MVVNLINPEVVLFVPAFIPQFGVSTSPILPQFLVLAAILASGGLLVNAAVGLAAGGRGGADDAIGAICHSAGRISAAIFTALAVRPTILQRE